MVEEKPKAKNRQGDSGAADRYQRVQNDIARQRARAERGTGGLSAGEAEELVGEIGKLLQEMAQALEGEELIGATKRFDVAIRRDENRLMITAIIHETFSEENCLPDLAGETL